MTWLRDLIAHLPLPRREPDAKSKRAERVLRHADRVLADYRNQDAALRFTKVPKR